MARTVKTQFRFVELKKIKYFFISFILILTVAGCGGGIGSSSNSTEGNASNQPATGSLTLSWYAPTVNDDGTPLTDLAGYRIFYGTTSQHYTNSLTIGNTTNYTVTNLQQGTYYFAIVAYDTSGNESDYSNELSVYITEG